MLICSIYRIKHDLGYKIRSISIVTKNEFNNNFNDKTKYLVVKR